MQTFSFVKICPCATWLVSFDNCVGYNSDDEWHSLRKYLVHGYELKKEYFYAFDEILGHILSASPEPEMM